MRSEGKKALPTTDAQFFQYYCWNECPFFIKSPWIVYLEPCHHAPVVLLIFWCFLLCFIYLYVNHYPSTPLIWTAAKTALLGRNFCCRSLLKNIWIIKAGVWFKKKKSLTEPQKPLSAALRRWEGLCRESPACPLNSQPQKAACTL